MKLISFVVIIPSQPIKNVERLELRFTAIRWLRSSFETDDNTNNNIVIHGNSACNHFKRRHSTIVIVMIGSVNGCELDKHCVKPPRLRSFERTSRENVLLLLLLIDSIITANGVENRRVSDRRCSKTIENILTNFR